MSDSEEEVERPVVEENGSDDDNDVAVPDAADAENSGSEDEANNGEEKEDAASEDARSQSSKEDADSDDGEERKAAGSDDEAEVFGHQEKEDDDEQQEASAASDDERSNHDSDDDSDALLSAKERKKKRKLQEKEASKKKKTARTTESLAEESGRAEVEHSDEDDAGRTKAAFLNDEEGDWGGVGKQSQVPVASGARRKLTAAEKAALDESQRLVAQKFLERMNMAYCEDQMANKEKRAALSKIKMLEEVAQMLQKRNMQTILKDEGVLRQIKLWLAPNPDRTLPNRNLMEKILTCLDEFHLDKDDLIDSGIGSSIRIIRDKSDSKSSLYRVASKLMSKWASIGTDTVTSYKAVQSAAPSHLSRIDSNFDKYPEMDPKRMTAIQPRAMPLVFSKNIESKVNKDTPSAKPKEGSIAHRFKKHHDNLKRSTSSGNKSLRAVSVEIKKLQNIDSPATGWTADV